MKLVKNFAATFGVSISLNPNFIVQKSGRYFLINGNMQKQLRTDFYYAGKYLGKIKNGKFFPSFHLLDLIVKTEANKVTIDDKSAWLFICGRDIYQRGILSLRGAHRKGNHTLILNRFHECLGFGKIICSIESPLKKREIAIKNILDVGDFLRRER